MWLCRPSVTDLMAEYGSPADLGDRQMALFDVPTEVVSVFEQFRTAEFTTIGKDGTPATWPITAVYYPDRCEFLAATSVGLPQKAVNIRRNPRVSLLFLSPAHRSFTTPRRCWFKAKLGPMRRSRRSMASRTCGRRSTVSSHRRSRCLGGHSRSA